MDRNMTTDDLDLTEDQIAQAEYLNKVGDLELDTSPKQETKPAKEPEKKAEPSKIKVGGEEYTEEELAEKLEIAKNPHEFVRKATYETQQVSNAKRELEREREQITQDRKKMDDEIRSIKASSLGDPAIEKTVSILEVQQRKLDQLEEKLNQRDEFIENQMLMQRDTAAIKMVKTMYDEAVDFFKAYPGVKIPKPGTKEFDSWVLRGQQISPLKVMAFETYEKEILKSGKHAPNLSGIESAPPSVEESGLSKDQLEAAALMNVSPATMKVVARNMGV